jgi:hypothetical protein
MERATPVGPVAAMGQERSVLRRFVRDGRPSVLGLHVIGDARCQTKPLGSTKPFRVSSKRLCHECATRVPFSTSFLSAPPSVTRSDAGVVSLLFSKCKE